MVKLAFGKSKNENEYAIKFKFEKKNIINFMLVKRILFEIKTVRKRVHNRF